MVGKEKQIVTKELCGHRESQNHRTNLNGDIFDHGYSRGVLIWNICPTCNNRQAGFWKPEERKENGSPFREVMGVRGA